MTLNNVILGNNEPTETNAQLCWSQGRSGAVSTKEQTNRMVSGLR